MLLLEVANDVHCSQDKKGVSYNLGALAFDPLYMDVTSESHLCRLQRTILFPDIHLIQNVMITLGFEQLV